MTNELCSKTNILMMKDVPVMRFNLGSGRYQILSNTYLPFQLRGSITGNNLESTFAMLKFLGNRVLPMSRENAKKILNSLHLSQSGSDINRAEISLAYRAVTLQDNYWTMQEGENKRWHSVDIRQNKLSNILANVALNGRSATIQGKIHTPEVSTIGTYAKCWRRIDGDLWLLKRGYKSDLESKIEVSVSNILDKCNVSHIKYEKTLEGKIYCCKCKCMTSQSISMLPADDFIALCTKMGKDWYQESLHIDAESMYKMFIVDYLISNSDRHNLNWGFFYNCDTMQILCCHPLYDHNNAFDKALIDNENHMSLVRDGATMRSLAVDAMRKVDFYFNKKIKLSDFVSITHYKSFKKRADYLGIKVK